MAQVRGRRELVLGTLLLLMLSLMVGCGSSDSGADVPPPQGTMAGAEHLQRVTLRITGMS